MRIKKTHMHVLVDMRDLRERTAYAIARDLRVPAYRVRRALWSLGRRGLMEPSGEVRYGEIETVVDRTWRITSAGLVASGSPAPSDA